MVRQWQFFFICQALPLVLSCVDADVVACSQWGLTGDNECIINPDYVACHCNASCSSLQSCPGGVSNDLDCKCRVYAMKGKLEEDPVTYSTLCPTTYLLRVTSGVVCTDVPPNKINNGVVDVTTLKATYRYMDKVQYDCVPGYTYTGYMKPTMVCDHDGEWYWGTQTGYDSCNVLVLEDETSELEEIDEFKPAVKEAKGAAIIGSFGIFIVVGVVGCIVGLDCVSCKKHVSVGKRNIRKFCKRFRGNGKIQTDKEEQPIESTELKSIYDITALMDEPCNSNNGCESASNNESVKIKVLPWKLPCTKTGNKTSRNSGDINGATVAPTSRDRIVIRQKNPRVSTTNKTKQILPKANTSIV